MKNMKLSAALLALAGVAFVATSAHAATSVATGDLILGFEDQNGTVTTNYEVNLGNIQTFLAVSGGSTLTFNLGTDLTNIYGANWNNVSGSTNLAWGVAGTSGVGGGAGFTANALFLTQAESTPGTLQPSLPQIGAGQGGVRSNIVTMETGPTASSGFAGEAANCTTFTNATTVLASGADSWGSQNAGTGFGYGTDIRNDFSGNLSGSGITGTAGAVSDLDVLVKNGTSTVAGTFQFNNGGVLTYTSVAAVPEPSTYALGLFGMLLFWVLKRRQSPEQEQA